MRAFDTYLMKLCVLSSNSRQQEGCRPLYILWPKQWPHYLVAIYTHCQDLMSQWEWWQFVTTMSKVGFKDLLSNRSQRYNASLGVGLFTIDVVQFAPAVTWIWQWSYHWSGSSHSNKFYANNLHVYRTQCGCWGSSTLQWGSCKDGT